MERTLEMAIVLDQWLEEIYAMDEDGGLTPEIIAKLLERTCTEFGISESDAKRAIASAITSD